MLTSINPSGLLRYIVFAWFLGSCYGFVLLSSAAGHSEVNLFKPGQSVIYQLHSSVILNEKSDEKVKNVGFYVSGDVVVQSVWGQGDDRILKVQLRSPRLHIRSRKAPAPDGFVAHSSKLEEIPSKPFYIVWHAGKVIKMFTPKDQPTSLANLQKGIASLFQFQLLDMETKETDSSGQCTVNYVSMSPNKFQKIKTNCLSSDLPYSSNSDPILETIVRSTRRSDYELDSTSSYFTAVRSKEAHQMHLAAREDIGNFLGADQILTFSRTETCKSIKASGKEQALEQVLNEDGIGYIEDSLVTKKEELGTEDKKIFFNTVASLRDNLKSKLLGSAVSAKAFIRLVEVARKAGKEDILKALNAKKNKDILPQIYDVLGFVQTEEAHETVMKKVHFDQEDHLDLSERYLWASSLAAHPNPEIINDLLKKYNKYESIPEKVKDTLLLTIASMTHKLPHSSSIARKIAQNVEETIVNGLDYAKNEARYIFLRALKNLKSPSTIPTLLETIKKGSTKEGVLAFKTLQVLDPSYWDSKVLKTATKAFLQLDRKYDTSARTLALDILLDSNPKDEVLLDVLHYLRSNDTSYEVKQYVFQTIQMKADEDDVFRSRVLDIIRKNPSLNNYSVLSPRGLSTALKRQFLKSSSTNGSLLTVQEISSGIVKRGIVNVVMDKDGRSKEMISLGIFAGGLGSFVSSDSEGDDETATAGIELTILGTQIRPFVFFTGQGELMGHVWSGTASERTTAYQALTLLQDHLEYIRLGSGFVAELNLKGAMSFDLSGKIEISIWSRNADSLVEKSAGIVAVGSIVVETSFLRSQVEFSASVEPKLSLHSNVDFSSNMMLCMQVSQPDTTFRHNIFKIERITGSQHKLRLAKYQKTLVPGTTYSLNRKNNEMCSAMFGG